MGRGSYESISIRCINEAQGFDEDIASNVVSELHASGLDKMHIKKKYPNDANIYS